MTATADPAPERSGKTLELVATLTTLALMIGMYVAGIVVFNQRMLALEESQKDVARTVETRLSEYCDSKDRSARKIGTTIVCADAAGRLYDVFAAK
jgi:hypothetical protein